jgi:starch phosphorylase
MINLPGQSFPSPNIKVAYFSMEIMLENDIATYAGGLGMLAGDILRSLADQGIPSVGVTMAFNNGYTNQVVNKDGTQKFVAAEWTKSDQLIKLSQNIAIQIEGHELIIEAYRYDIVGKNGFVVPVYLLTTDHYENTDEQKYFTKYLYDHDKRIRLIQEVILGIGGVKMLRSLGYHNIENFHMNDGHCAFLTLEVLREQNYDLEKTKNLSCFTTHTPVAAGRDQFEYDIAQKVMNQMLPLNIHDLAGTEKLDMPVLANTLSKYTNGVSRKHGEVSSDMFKKNIDYITNGIHLPTWLSPITQEFYDKYLPSWRNTSTAFFKINEMPDDSILQMHNLNKHVLIDFVNKYLDQRADTGSRFDYDTLTITFARRFVTYKRPDLIFHDLKRLLRLGIGKIQIIFAGKTHPEDKEAHDLLKQIVEYRSKFAQVISIAFIENYNPSIAKLLVSGSDIWLNNPAIPLEASGTSGMKAAANGTINLSILDGWFIEGIEKEPQSSFIIGDLPKTLYPEGDEEKDADSLYNILETQVIPMFYNDKKAWLEKMKGSIRLASYFNTDRVVEEYLEKAWI